MSARKSVIVVGLLAVAGVLAFGGWYLFAQGEEPPPVSLERALQDLEAPPASAGARATPAVAAATAPTDAVAGASRRLAPGASPVGAWTVEPSASFVGYRVNEELVRLGANTAVGRTSAVSGELRFDGTNVTLLEVTADMRNLRSDDSRRDNFLRQQALETSRFPEAVFVLGEPIAISVAAAEGATMSALARGDLTVHGVTRRVEIPVEGRLTGGKLLVVGSTTVGLGDFAIAKPRVPAVLSIEDDAVIELSLVFAPAEG